MSIDDYYMHRYMHAGYLYALSRGTKPERTETLLRKPQKTMTDKLSDREVLPRRSLIGS